ncbi:unnamed protein product [Candidula unifasciata]|uniref:G-protein coupled receptors family 1 profile domain-containing protein n=1 Tax=Candidula unifasciata TaxID=100452 RepID=A0A8S3ZJW7_9EUPU|nr:unnamed protein product [Candidula unifasciata]
MGGTKCIDFTQGTNIQSPSMLIDDSAENIIIDVLYIGAGFCISLFGIIANTINIIVYLNRGVKDSPTVQFLSLSVSDCVFSVLVLMSSVGYFFIKIKSKSTILDPTIFSHFVSASREKAYSISVLIIFVMSLERSFCVAYPFTIKLIFTKSRSIVTITFLTVILTAALIPEYLNNRLEWVYDTNLNSSHLVYWSSREATTLDVLRNTIFAAVLPIVSGVSATVCTIYMISAVKASNKFRQFAVTGKRLDTSLKDTSLSEIVQAQKTKTKKLTKETRITRTVIAVNIIFILCNLPKSTMVASSVANLYIPEFSLFVKGKYQNLVSVLITITFMFEAINGASTFIVYYTMNTTFKTTVKQILCKCFDVN